MTDELLKALERVADRYRGVRLWSGLALCWLAFALAGWGYASLLSGGFEGGWIPVPFLMAWLIILAVAGVAVAGLVRRSARDPRWVARRVEAKYPELGTGLLAAVEESSTPSARQGYLQAAVIRGALDHGNTHNWPEVVPSWSLTLAKLAHFGSLALLAAATVALGGHVRSKALGFPPPPTIAAVADDVEVDPGDASIEKGTSLLVVAKFPNRVPADAKLAVLGSTGIPMARSLEDPTFAGRVELVEADFAYRVEFDGRATKDYKVTVFEYPEVRRTDAKLAFPSYTAMETKVVEDIRHVTAVEGTELTLTCRLNKEVVEAALVDEKGTATLLAATGEPKVHAATFTLADSHKYKVKLVDAEGRSSKVPAEVSVNVTRNRPATVTMARPSRDVRVSPVEELSLQAKAVDDFGVVRHGLEYTLAEREPVEVVLDSPKVGTKAVNASHLLTFEGLKARPDQLVTYTFWAEDIGPDGKPRRSSSDLFFAEVRHFEEIFRQGEAPPSGSSQQPQQGGNGQEAEKLAELQKKVINATWTLIRREAGALPTAAYAADTKAVEEAQHSAIEQAEALAQKLREPDSKEDLAAAVASMKAAERKLAETAKGPAIPPLRPALASEQAAYQGLLKLRAREFEVSRRNQQGGGGGGQAGPSQQQLDQLQLSDEENRYEQQNSARSGGQKQQEQRETRQVLNRLGELARRQGDLNDRLKELQSALEAAKDPKAREEIERQLKRLREQQQQILRDADELRERMEREENRERMAEERKKLEEGREHVRQASEALEKGQIPQAVTEGARAGRDLNDLREDLRKKSSDRFSEEVTEMREQARRLDEKQKRAHPSSSRPRTASLANPRSATTGRRGRSRRASRSRASSSNG